MFSGFLSRVCWPGDWLDSQFYAVFLLIEKVARGLAGIELALVCLVFLLRLIFAVRILELFFICCYNSLSSNIRYDMLRLTLKDSIYIFEWEFIVEYHGLLSLNLVLPMYYGTISSCLCIMVFYRYSPKSPFISVCHCIMALSAFVNRCLFQLARVSRHYFTPNRRLFRLAYVSWHHRYFHITVYFGSARVSRHRYSSHIIKYLVVVPYDSSAIYHGYSVISVSEASSHLYPNSISRTIAWLVTSLCWFGKPNDTLAHHISILTRWAERYLHLLSILVR